MTAPRFAVGPTPDHRVESFSRDAAARITSHTIPVSWVKAGRAQAFMPPVALPVRASATVRRARAAELLAALRQSGMTFEKVGESTLRLRGTRPRNGLVRRELLQLQTEILALLDAERSQGATARTLRTRRLLAKSDGRLIAEARQKADRLRAERAAEVFELTGAWL